MGERKPDFSFVYPMQRQNANGIFKNVHIQHEKRAHFHQSNFEKAIFLLFSTVVVHDTFTFPFVNTYVKLSQVKLRVFLSLLFRWQLALRVLYLQC